MDNEPRAQSKPKSVHVQRIGRLYYYLDKSTAGLIYIFLIFTPWAFGTTNDWSTWIADVIAYVLGGLTAAKYCIRRFSAIQPARWDSQRGRFFIRGIFVLNVLVLAYGLTSALNWRAKFDELPRLFTYRDAIPWLPHSYDVQSTWFFWSQAVGLSCIFWAVRDWLSGKSREEVASGSEDRSVVPARLRRMLWILSVNGFLVAIEGIFQRLEGSGKLLFFHVPRFNKEAEYQFGPWAYRANAAQYFNLLWPVTLGFWYWLQTEYRRKPGQALRMGSDPKIVLVLMAIVMAACPIMSSSRGGAIFDVFLVLGSMVLFVVFRQKSTLATTLLTVVFISAGLALGLYLGWDTLEPRLVEMLHGDSSQRIEIYANARQMARDFFLLGSGPGTFSALYQLYRIGDEDVWAAYAHNDWLENLITYGIIGESLIILALVLAVTRFFRGGGMRIPSFFYWFVVMSISACLSHAFIDLPLRVYSIQALLMVWCAVLSVSGRRSVRATASG